MICVVYAYPREVKYLKLNASKLKIQLFWLPWSKAHTRRYCAAHIPLGTKLILNVGFAASLNSRFSLGQVCLVNLFLAEQGGKLLKLRNDNIWSFKASAATLFTSQVPVTNSIMRQKLAEETKADLVDMEAFWILKLAQSLNIPFLCFKVVSDYANEESEQLVKGKGKIYAQILAEKVLEFLENQIIQNGN